MRKVALILFLGTVIAGSAMAVNPSLMAGGGGPPNVLPGGRDTMWSEPPDLNGLIASSEQILVDGIETEIANDFYVTSDDNVGGAKWWGGYWNNSVACDPGYTGATANLRIYNDGGCMPLNVLGEYLNVECSETYIGCQQSYYPLFSYECYFDGVPIPQNTLFWFGAQLADHPFPPQWGRLAAAVVTNCDSVFKSAYFAYPDWTPGIDVFGQAFDASQELYQAIPPYPVHETTWGGVKALFK